MRAIHLKMNILQTTNITVNLKYVLRNPALRLYLPLAPILADDTVTT